MATENFPMSVCGSILIIAFLLEYNVFFLEEIRHLGQVVSRQIMVGGLIFFQGQQFTNKNLWLFFFVIFFKSRFLTSQIEEFSHSHFFFGERRHWDFDLILF